MSKPVLVDLDFGSSAKITGLPAPTVGSDAVTKTYADGLTGTTNLSYTAATRIIASDTGIDATLPLMSSGDAGLVPASGGGTTNFLRADGTFAAPGGGGGVSDGDKGDITVTATGATWRVDPNIKYGLPIVLAARAFNL